MGNYIKRYWPVFVLPTLAAFIIGFIWPFIWGTYLSFFSFKTLSKTTFVGFQNYIDLFGKANFGFTDALGRTVIFTAITSVLINVIAFFIALALTRKLKGSNVFRTVFFLPNLIGGIVLGFTWKTLLNGVLSGMNMELLALNATHGFWGLVILTCWQQIGYMMVIYIAGLQNVPGDILEAAAIDGATPLQTLVKIKLPMVMPSITICAFLTLTNSFKLFDQNLALTGGEPNGTSQLLALNIYKTFTEYPKFKGVAQAKAFVFFLMVVAISLIQLYFTKRKEVQQ
ncbi:MAG: sugar ABC transporter permease [Clostridia bacterium]|nr:sugar ABC transporter permease [Clostridia bacterium]